MAQAQVTIRERQLDLAALSQRFAPDEAAIARAQADYRDARPYPFLEIDGLFDETLLDLVVEEFDAMPRWREVKSGREHVYRAPAHEEFGPATRLYMSLVNSPDCVRYLSAVTGIANLIPDVTAVGGGPHETRNGGHFAIHRDFLYHRETGLQNALVMITYLNRDWQPDYGGELELWDKTGKVRATAPLFGRTIMIGHPHRAFHGCPNPLTAPEGRHRRSIASYFYINPHIARTTTRTSVFLERPGFNERLRLIARGATPPAVWSLVGSAKRRLRG